MRTHLHQSCTLLAVSIGLGLLLAASASASPVVGNVALHNSSATFTQDGGFSTALTIDGVVNGIGWAIDHQEGTAQTAAYQTVTDLGSRGFRQDLTIKLFFDYPFPRENLGDFRLSVTNDHPASGVTATSATTWTVLTPTSATALFATLTPQGDHSILASGTNHTAGGAGISDSEIYTITASTTLSGITGLRLEALTDASLPHNGPGGADDGNFVLSEITVDAVAVPLPEPATGALLGLGGVFMCLRRRPRPVVG